MVPVAVRLTNVAPDGLLSSTAKYSVSSFVASFTTGMLIVFDVSFAAKRSVPSVVGV